MKKKLIAMAVAGAIAAPVAAQAMDTSVSGFGDILYTIKAESADKTAPDPKTGAITKNSAENKFSATGEVDFTASEGAVSARVDVDLNTSPPTDPGSGNIGDSGSMEQVFAAWKINDAVTVIGGTFNNPMGLEGEDTPSLYTTSHGQIWNILDSQTKLWGNNVQGVAAAFGLGMVDVTVGLLNDLQQQADKSSFVINANASPVENLNLEAGFVTQAKNESLNPGCVGPGDCNAGSGENIFDINGTYKWNGLTVGAEYLGAGALVDNAYGLFGNYDVGNGFGATVRWDTVSYDTKHLPGQGDTSNLTLAANYAPAENLNLLLEYNDFTNDTVSTVKNDFSSITFEIVATLGDYKN